MKTSCEYCTPNKHGKRKALKVVKYPLKNHAQADKYKKNVTKVFREKNKKNGYFIGTLSKDLSKDEKIMYRNNGFIYKERIISCPKCNKDLRWRHFENRNL